MTDFQLTFDFPPNPPNPNSDFYVVVENLDKNLAAKSIFGVEYDKIDNTTVLFNLVPVNFAVLRLFSSLYLQ